MFVATILHFVLSLRLNYWQRRKALQETPDTSNQVKLPASKNSPLPKRDLYEQVAEHEDIVEKHRSPSGGAINRTTYGGSAFTPTPHKRGVYDEVEGDSDLEEF